MRLRKGVVGVFIDRDGKLLVCERSNIQDVWQFPQGGIDDGESEDQAITREMSEELGTQKFKIVQKSDIWTSYLFPKGSNFPIAKTHDGQIHCWFLLRFEDGVEPNLDASDGEFLAFRWVNLSEAVAGVVEWKRPAYIEGLRSLGLHRG